MCIVHSATVSSMVASTAGLSQADVEAFWQFVEGFTPAERANLQQVPVLVARLLPALDYSMAITESVQKQVAALGAPDPRRISTVQQWQQLETVYNRLILAMATRLYSRFWPAGCPRYETKPIPDKG